MIKLQSSQRTAGPRLNSTGKQTGSDQESVWTFPQWLQVTLTKSDREQTFFFFKYGYLNADFQSFYEIQ